MFYVKVKKALDGNNIDGDGRVILVKIVEICGDTLVLREYGVDELFVMRPTSHDVLGNLIFSTRCVVVGEEYALKKIYERTSVEQKTIKGIISPLAIRDMYPNIKWYSEHS